MDTLSHEQSDAEAERVDSSSVLAGDVRGAVTVGFIGSEGGCTELEMARPLWWQRLRSSCQTWMLGPGAVAGHRQHCPSGFVAAQCSARRWLCHKLPMLGAAVASLPDARRGSGFVARCSARQWLRCPTTWIVIARFDENWRNVGESREQRCTRKFMSRR